MKEYALNQSFSFTFCTHGTSGADVDADLFPLYRVYEDGNDTVIATGTCTKRDDANTTGFYVASGDVTLANGYAVGKTYDVKVRSVIGGIFTSEVVGQFRVIPDNVMNSLVAGTDYIDSAVATGGIALASFATGAIGPSVLATGAISQYALSAEAIDKILDEEVGSASAADDSVRSSLKAAWAQGFGRWTIVGTTLTLYGPNGTDVYRTFELDSATFPTMRWPV